MAAGRAFTGWQLAALALAWVAGCAWQLQQPVLWPLLHYQGLCVGALLALWLAAWAQRAGQAGLRQVLAVAGLLVLAFSSTGWRAEQRLVQRLSPALEGRNLLVTGVVAAMPQSGASGLRFVFEVEQALAPGGVPVQLPGRLALGWYNAFQDEALLADPRAELRAGQRWQLPLRLKRPHGAVNPGGFDAELWWFEQDLGATGYVRVTRQGPPARLLAEAQAHPVERLRQTLRDAILRQVADPRAAGVLAALVVGDQAAIEREDWELFRNTGLAHLVAISGVHITMFAWLAGRLIGAAWRRSSRLMLALPAPVAARLGGVALAAGYALLAGWGVPAQRTVLMLAAAALLRQAGAGWPWLLVLLGAGVVVTAADPWALLQAGFWLSFAAVGLLMLSAPARGAPVARGWRGVLRGELRSQLIASLGLAPLSLLFFQQVSVVGLLANLVAIPLVTLLITPLALAGVLLPALWWLAASLVQGGVLLLQGLAGWPGAVWTVAAAPPWALACGLGAALLGVLPLPWRMRWLALPLAVPMLWPPVPRPAEGRFELVAADVGQGTAALLRTRQHLLVYDAGPQYSRESDAGARVLLPLLRHRGERAIDLLMLSHRDSDHVGGAASLLAALPVRALSSSLEDGHPLRHAHPALPHTRCLAGQRWTWDGVQFELLHPLAGDEATARKPNDLSCVLRVQDAQGRSVLLTGDIEAPQEAALLQRAAAALPSTVLFVPHHGSRTSSTEAFIAAVRPQWAVVQAGYRSRFGHPAPDVLARYAAQGVAVVRSDDCGAWTWDGEHAHCQRALQPRYWQAGPVDWR